MNRCGLLVFYLFLGLLACLGVLASWHFLSKIECSVTATSFPHPKPNYLIHEKSPYLLQHAYNPVNWYPWGSKAFEKAKKENKPIFLSIGYSTCHWCHVMEHESFENPEIAKILNDHFISIKVDREERPDLDQIYMAATQAMTGSGGWPMSVWLNHNLEPFYAGTYFPPDDRYGRPGFPELLKRIHEAWVENRSKIDATAKNLGEALKKSIASRSGESSIPPSAIAEAYQHFRQTFDAVHGGFGSAPKFPRAVQFPFLFRYYMATGDRHALDMALFTLRKMARGGIYDQLGGGFARYSVDAEWRVPHFEKMLYDNGQLLSIYTEAWQITHDGFYQQVARDIIRYIAREMTSKDGAFYSAEDADSDGEEGAFYVWTEKEVRLLLGDDAAQIVMTHYDFQPQGNFEHGKNVLHNIYSIQETAQKTGKTETEVRKILEGAKTKLFQIRSRRTRPHLDDKILTAWNGLMISGMAQAGLAFEEKDFVERAAQAANFILSHLRDPKTGRLLRRYRDGEAKGSAFLDDYTFFAAGLLDLFEASQDPRWLKEAIRITDEQIHLFWDGKDGGFFFAGVEDSTLLMRPKSDYEGAEPSGNSVAITNLLRLAQWTDKREYREKAEQTMKALSENVQRFAASMPMMLCAFSDSLRKSQQIIIAGDPGKADTQAMWREVTQRYLPNTMLLLVNGGRCQAEMTQRLPFLAEIKPLNGKATAYVCQDYTCQTPTSDLEIFRKLLEHNFEYRSFSPQ